jgi:hypothetical protein
MNLLQKMPKKLDCSWVLWTLNTTVGALLQTASWIITACKMRNSRDICRSLKKIAAKKAHVCVEKVCPFEQNSDDDN